MVTLVQILAAEDEKRKRKHVVTLPLPVSGPQRATMPPVAPSRTFTPDIPFEKYRGRVRKRLKRVLKSYQDGEISLAEFEKRVKIQLDASLGYSFSSGSGQKELSKEDEAILDGIKDTQYEYFDGFLEDMQSGEFTMPLEQRIGMYADSLTQAFWMGNIRGADDTAQFNWVTTPGENCDDCLDLEAQGPYAKGDLPTVPGAGDTACRQNCNCFLEPLED
jgi:hypothetical protein